MAAAAFIVVLTFFVGPLPGIAGTTDYTLACVNKACVNAVIERMPESHALIRLRVYETPNWRPMAASRFTAFPPLKDYWRQ